MNKNKNFGVLLVSFGLVLFALLVLAYHRYNVTGTAEVAPYERTAIVEPIDFGSIAPATLLQEAVIEVPEANALVKLTDGHGSYVIAPDSASRGEVVVLPGMNTLWGEAEDRTDLTAVVVKNEGGSGTFHYLTLFDVDGNIFTKKSEFLLGDRIQITDIGLGELEHGGEADYRVTVQTLERADGAAMAEAPTIPKTRTFYVTDQVVEEVEVGQDDS